MPEVTSGGHASLHEAIVELRRGAGWSASPWCSSLGAMVEGGIGTFGVLYLRDRLDVAVLAGAGAYVLGQAPGDDHPVRPRVEQAGAHLGGSPARPGSG